MKKNVIALLIVIVAVLVVGGGLYYYQTGKKTTPNPVIVENKVGDLTSKNTTPNPVTAENKVGDLTSKKTTPNPVVIENKVSDLQTYTNSDYGYSFQYPKGYSVGMRAASMVVTQDNGVLGQWVYSTGAGKNTDNSLTDFVNRIIDAIIARPRSSGIPLKRSDINVTDTTIGGNPAKEIIVKNNGDYGNAVAVTIYGDKISLQVWGDAPTPESETGFNAFLKTFKLN